MDATPTAETNGSEVALEFVDGALDVEEVTVRSLTVETEAGAVVGLAVAIKGARIASDEGRSEDRLLFTPDAMAAFMAAAIASVVEADPTAAANLLATVAAELEAGQPGNHPRIVPVRYRFPGDDRVSDPR